MRTTAFLAAIIGANLTGLVLGFCLAIMREHISPQTALCIGIGYIVFLLILIGISYLEDPARADDRERLSIIQKAIDEGR